MIRALSAVAAVAVVACGAVGGGSYITQPPPVATPTAAVAQWAGFPADQNPRPIVLFWELYTTGGGFKDGDSKLAALCNKFSLATSLPREVPANGSATSTTRASSPNPPRQSPWPCRRSPARSRMGPLRATWWAIRGR